MDDRWETEVIEYGAINITGFRIVDSSRRYVKDFLDGWKRLDPATSQGAGKESVSVTKKNKNCFSFFHPILNEIFNLLFFLPLSVYSRPRQL